MRRRSTGYPPIVTGLFHPLNIFMLGLSVLAGLVSAWWMFPVGLVFWLVMVIAVARIPALQFDHQMRQREPLAQRFQRYFNRIERAQINVFSAQASAPARVRRALKPVEDEVAALTNQVHQLCLRMTKLENYRVVSESRSDLKTDIQRIEDALRDTDDPLVKQQYEASRQSLQDRLAQIQAVSSQLDRVEAQLMSLANEMDGVVAEVMRLQAMGAKSAAEGAPALIQTIRSEADELSAFERQAVQV